MRLATQQDVDKFMSSVMFDESVYPYLSESMYVSNVTIETSDWNRVVLTNDTLSVILKVEIARESDNAFSVCLWSTNPISAGRALKALEVLIKRYNPKSISSCVHESNIKSINLHKKLYGEPWGTEPEGAWNSLLGKWEGLVNFKKILR